MKYKAPALSVHYCSVRETCTPYTFSLATTRPIKSIATGVVAFLILSNFFQIICHQAAAHRFRCDEHDCIRSPRQSAEQRHSGSESDEP